MAPFARLPRPVQAQPMPDPEQTFAVPFSIWRAANDPTLKARFEGLFR